MLLLTLQDMAQTRHRMARPILMNNCERDRLCGSNVGDRVIRVYNGGTADLILDAVEAIGTLRGDKVVAGRSIRGRNDNVYEWDLLWRRSVVAGQPVYILKDLELCSTCHLDRRLKNWNCCLALQVRRGTGTCSGLKRLICTCIIGMT